MRAIIVGAGGVGRQVAAALVRERHEVLIAERDAERLEPLHEHLDAQLVAGNGASPHVLRELGAADTDLLIAATGSDETNLVASMVARELGTRRTVVRLHGEDYLERGQSLEKTSSEPTWPCTPSGWRLSPSRRRRACPARPGRASSPRGA